MFEELIEKFKSLPGSVRNGILFMLTGWLWHYIILYTNFIGHIPQKQLAIGVCICFLVYMMMNKKGWARALCMLCNLFIIVQFLPVALVCFSGDQFKLGMLATLSIFFFSSSTYHLAVKESSEFFKKEKKKDKLET